MGILSVFSPSPLTQIKKRAVKRSIIKWAKICYGLFTLPDPDSDSDSNSDSKPHGYIVLSRIFHIGSDPDPDPNSDGFPNGYCAHFRDRSLSLLHTF